MTYSERKKNYELGPKREISETNLAEYGLSEVKVTTKGESADTFTNETVK